MPTYQYSCTECGHFFEQFQSFNEDSLTVCPQCQGRLRKVFNAVGVVFKGSGFYRTDSRSDGRAGGGSGDGGSKAESGAAQKGSSAGDKAGSGGSSGGSSGGGSSSGSAPAPSGSSTSAA